MKEWAKLTRDAYGCVYSDGRYATQDSALGKFKGCAPVLVKCTSCAYWVPFKNNAEGKNEGDCVKRAPVVSDAACAGGYDPNAAWWPATDGDSGCGDWRVDPEIADVAFGDAERGRSQMLHDLKTWPEPFKALKSGKKRFEIRKADRSFQVGDHLQLWEWNPETKARTGESLLFRVMFILEDVESFGGLTPGFCCMSIKHVAERR